jgi:hypothetical protein
MNICVKKNANSAGKKVSFLISREREGSSLWLPQGLLKVPTPRLYWSLNQFEPIGILILNKEREEHVKASPQKKCEFSPLSPCFFFA